jgi:uncharacterized protein (TIGR03435 family)
MKRAILCAVGLMALLGTALSAQTIAGTWQGTLPIGPTGQGTTPGSGNPRIVFTIEKKPDGSFHGGVTSIDRGNSLPFTSVTFSASNVTFAVGDALNYRGKLSADGKSIAGTWTQGNLSLPLNLQLATAETLWKPERAPQLPPMAASADPSFEVAIIKPTGPDENNTLFDLRARKFSSQHTSAKELIKIAYNVRGRQVLGGPAWLEETKFDVVGEPDTEGLPSEAQNRVMVRKLLEERFHLVAHTNKQPFPVLALTLDPKGPRLTPSDPSLNNNGGMSARRDGDDVILQFSGTTIPQFIAFVMNTFQDKQLVDETGLSGIYDITLRLAGLAQGPVSSDDQGNALVLAAQHAGFKLVSKKEPLPVVVVDHIDLPTPN